MEYEMEGARSRCRPKKTWRDFAEKDWHVIEGGGCHGL